MFPKRRSENRMICALLLAALIFGQTAGNIRIHAAETTDHGVWESTDAAGPGMISESGNAENQAVEIINETGVPAESETEAAGTGIREAEENPEAAEIEPAISEERAGDQTVSSGICGAEGDNITWTVTESEGSYTLNLSGSGQMASYPDWSQGYRNSWCEEYRDRITKVTFTGNITSTGENAFSCCDALEEIVLPDTITEMEFGTFQICSKLKKVTLPQNITALPGGCFYHCSLLKSIEIPSTVTVMGDSLFEGCTHLENVKLPAGITKLPERCFYQCKSLKKLKVPEGVTEIGQDAFFMSSAFNVIGLPKSLVSVGFRAFDTRSASALRSNLSIVYYTGSSSDFQNIRFEDQNQYLTDAKIIYDTEMPDSFPASSVSVDETEYTLETGHFAYLRADVHPRYANDVSFTWTSTNDSVAAVDQDGKVTALSPGTADIIATEPGGKSASCRVKVVESADDKNLSLRNNKYTSSGFTRKAPLGRYGKSVTSHMFDRGNDHYVLRFAGEIDTSRLDRLDQQIILSRYDRDYNLLSRKEIPAELPYWGGFYASEDAFYIVTGQVNPEESPEIECFRVTKYDQDWNRLGSAPLFDCNTSSTSFSSGSLRMAEKGGYLIVRTCHDMYKTYDGINHQSNATFLYDMKKMEICDSMMDMDLSVGYVSHSFNQFIGIDEDGLVMLDHGDGYPRSFVLCKSPQDISRGFLVEDDGTFIHLMEFPGEIGENETGALINGFAMGKNRYIAAGSSVIQDERNTERKTYNIFVATADNTLSASNIHWFTNDAEGEPGYVSPQLVKLSEERFLLLWQNNTRNTWPEPDSDPVVYYTLINENGESVSPVYHHNGKLSDCVPVISDGQIIWFVCDYEKMTFYGIATDDISKFTVNGSESPSEVEKPSGGRAEVAGVTLNIHKATLYAGETLMLSAAVAPEDAADRSVTFESSAPSVAKVDKSGKVTAVSEGNAVITVTTVSGNKTDRMTLKVLPSEVEEEDRGDPSEERKAGGLWASGLKAEYYYTGYAIKPDIRIYRGERRLKEKSDYTIRYKNNVKVTPSGAPDSKKARITVTLKGNYGGNKYFYFSVVPAPLSSLQAADEYAKYEAGRKNNNIRPVLTLSGQEVRYTNRDISLEYLSGNSASGCIEKGEYIIRMTAKDGGSFTGTADVKLTVDDRTPVRKVRVSGLKKNYAYTGDPIKPEIRLLNGREVLEEGRDYTVCFSDNVEIGKAVMTISGCAPSYAGIKKLTFNITGKYTLSENNVDFVYDGGKSYYTYGGAKPEVAVYFRGQRLRAGIDYQVSYKWNKKVAGVSEDKPPQAVVKGKGIYKTAEKAGIVKPFSIEPMPLSSLVPVISDRAFSTVKNNYKKTSILFMNENYVNQKLKQGSAFDYTVEYTVSDGSAVPRKGETVSVSINAGSRGNYTGSVTGSYRIISPDQDINRAAVKINGGKPCAYTGSGIEPGKTGEPELLMTIKKGGKTTALKQGSDFEILGYYNNVNKGKGVVRLRGIGSYKGVRAVSFSIKAAGWK